MASNKDSLEEQKEPSLVTIAKTIEMTRRSTTYRLDSSKRVAVGPGSLCSSKPPLNSVRMERRHQAVQRKRSLMNEDPPPDNEGTIEGSSMRMDAPESRAPP